MEVFIKIKTGQCDPIHTNDKIFSKTILGLKIK